MSSEYLSCCRIELLLTLNPHGFILFKYAFCCLNFYFVLDYFSSADICRVYAHGNKK